jgi:hypothetical protein
MGKTPVDGVRKGEEPMPDTSNDWLSLGAMCVVILASLIFFFSQVLTYA